MGKSSAMMQKLRIDLEEFKNLTLAFDKEVSNLLILIT